MGIQTDLRRMTKSDLIKRLVLTHPDLSHHDVERIVDTVLGTITIALCRAQRVELRGFGSFSVRQHDSRTGRNPRAGAKVTVPAKAVPHFKTGKALFERLNEAADI